MHSLRPVLHLQNGDVAMIIGKGAKAQAPYVQSLKLNGNTWDKPWIYYSNILNGGRLVYELGSTPNKQWGSDAAAAPPS